MGRAQSKAHELETATSSPNSGGGAESPSQPMFVVDMYGTAYGLWCKDVVEVLPLVEIDRVAGAPPGVLGVINVRGRLVPAIDHRRLRDEKVSDAPFEYFVLVATPRGPVAVAVTGASDVVAVDPAEICYPGGGPEGSPAVVRVDDNTVHILRIDDLDYGERA